MGAFCQGGCSQTGLRSQGEFRWILLGRLWFVAISRETVISGMAFMDSKKKVTSLSIL